jgi:DNA polymerase-3 subunit delta'
MQFKNIIGQHELIEKIIILVNNHHLPHALLLAGNEGSGGLPLALATAQFILCANKSASDSCGECSACIKMNKLQHPDVHFSFPSFKSDPNKIPVSNHFIREFREFIQTNPYGTDTEWLKFLGTDKQGNITAQECREIIQKLQLRSFESEYKILIMWYPEYLDKEGNILLKLIEEPTDRTLLFFVSTNVDNILPTIQSRTQLFALKRLTDLEVKNALVNQGLSESLATQYARIAEGNYNYAQSLINHQDDDMVNVLRNWLNCLYANKGIELVDWVNSISEKNKESQKKFLEYVIQLFEHLIRFKNIGSQNLVLLESEQKMIDVLISKGLSDFNIAEMNEILNDSIYHIERNASSKILFHSLSLRIQKIVLRKTLAF